jgi:hypothetical protein
MEEYGKKLSRRYAKIQMRRLDYRMAHLKWKCLRRKRNKKLSEHICNAYSLNKILQ